MAKIIENKNGRRTIRLTTNDIISIVREYQNITINSICYEDILNKLQKIDIFIPEDIA